MRIWALRWPNQHSQNPLPLLQQMTGNTRAYGSYPAILSIPTLPKHQVDIFSFPLHLLALTGLLWPPSPPSPRLIFLSLALSSSFPLSSNRYTPGMSRAAAINLARVGAQKLWAGTVTIQANAKTGAHHHGHLESVIYVVRGRARMRWGEQLEFTAEAGPGDFIFVPPYVPHQEINALEDQELECVLVRSDGEAVAVNLPDLTPVERPLGVRWVDPTHEHLPHD